MKKIRIWNSNWKTSILEWIINNKLWILYMNLSWPFLQILWLKVNCNNHHYSHNTIFFKCTYQHTISSRLWSSYYNYCFTYYPYFTHAIPIPTLTTAFSNNHTQTNLQLLWRNCNITTTILIFSTIIYGTHLHQFPKCLLKYTNL